MNVVWLLVAITIVPDETIPFVAFVKKERCELIAKELNKHPQRTAHCERVDIYTYSAPVITHNKKENKRGQPDPSRDLFSSR